jgi:AraC family transcriptional regulator of arabinose operon
MDDFKISLSSFGRVARVAKKQSSRIPENRIAEGFSGQRLVIVPPERIAAVRRMPVLRDLQVTHFGHFGPAPNHFVRRRNGTGEHILIYCLAGRGYCETGGDYWQMATGDAVILRPDSFHTYHADPSDPWTIFWFHFIGERAADYAAALPLEGDCPVVHAPRPNALRQAFEESYRHSLHGFSDGSLLGLSTGLGRVIALLNIYSRPRSLRSYRTEDRILEAIRRMQAEPTREWLLDDLASGAGVSAPYFCEAFRKQTGTPPKQFLIQQRLQMACALMHESDLTISQIADRVGYEDPYYFSRLFQKKMGMSPRCYRMQIAHE